MSNSNIPSPTSYLDFSGLSDLRHRAAKDGDGALRETAKQFEALFIQMMMKSMRDATFKSDLLQSDTQDTYQEMFDKELSVKLADRGCSPTSSCSKSSATSCASSLSPSPCVPTPSTLATTCPCGGRSTPSPTRG